MKRQVNVQTGYLVTVPTQQYSTNMNLFSNCTRLLSNLLQTGDAKEDPEELGGCREENCVITLRNLEHLFGWVSGDDEILVGSEDVQVLPCPNVIAVHLSELGRREW